MIFRFGTCLLDSDRYEFFRCGDPVHLEPQVFTLLHVLVIRPGDVITKEHLVETVWQGLNVSDSTINARINAARKAVGDNGRDQRIIRTIHGRGFQLAVDVETDGQGARDVWTGIGGVQQDVRFAKSSGGARIAHATCGSGPPLVRMGHWLSHLELDWDSPVWRPLITALSHHHSLYRYDQRGTGLSGRALDNVTLDDFVDDLAAVADACGLDRFPIFAASQAVPVAVRFATRFPDRLSAMVLYGGFAQGRALRDPLSGDIDEDTVLNLIRAGWGRENSPFVRAFATLFVPDATQEQLDSLVRMQMQSVSPENAATLRQIIDRFSVVDELSMVTTPTLVIHADADAIQPVDQGRLLAAEIPGAKFVMLESRNHIPLPQEASWDRLVLETLTFIGGQGQRVRRPAG
jgi:DNA-binding winged helix-turn-helix (wHTH) protein/pimeloyl-ACP methyl ester carboxylesterase